ncbi:hypothetical protein ABT009_24575 [Streptomyces sp. NPDC002896]|uniref:hypothetical protein n=1 Tax=Streptomyces sp. NPDC002896 TaxID=3154438 RepID=UPI00332DFD32
MTESASPSPGSAAAVPESAYTFRLPIAKYSFSNAELAAIEAAEGKLTEECMARFGLDYSAEPPSVREYSSDRRYGISSGKDAARYGYHLPADESPESGAEGGDATTRLVLYGTGSGGEAKTYRGIRVPENGCRGEAVKSLRKGNDYPAGSEAARTVANSSFQSSLKDPRVVQAAKDWSACMKSAGYTYDSPLAAMGDKAFQGEKVTRGEISTAEADYSCKTRTRLLDVWFRAESEIQDKMIADHKVDLGKLNAAHMRMISAAQKVIEER